MICTPVFIFSYFFHLEERETFVPPVTKIDAQSVTLSSPETPDNMDETITVTKVRRQVEMNVGEPILPEPTIQQADALKLLTDNLVEMEKFAPPVHVERSYFEGEFKFIKNDEFCFELK